MNPNIKNIVKYPRRIYTGYLAEEYDGMGQYVMVSLARSSTSVAMKARIAAGDFGGSRRFPAGTRVPVVSVRGQLEVLLGNHPSPAFCEEFNRSMDPGWGTGRFGTWENIEGNQSDFLVDGNYGVITTPATDNQYQRLPSAGKFQINLPFELLIEVEAVGNDPFVGWSGSSSGGRSDFTFETQVDPNYFDGNRAYIALFLFGTYPNTVLGLSAFEGRDGLGSGDTDDVIPFDWPVYQQTVGPIMVRFYVDDHGVYGRIWLKDNPEPLVMQGEGEPAPWDIIGNVLNPFHGSPTERAAWEAGGWGKGEPWSAYAVNLGGYSNPDPFEYYVIGSAGLGGSSLKFQRICYY